MSISLSSEAQYNSWPAVHANHKLYTLAMLRASDLEDERRKPVDLVVVLDRSSSMQGEKLDLCLKTVEFLMKELTSRDRLSLVSYDASVKTHFRLTNMTREGKETTARHLKGVVAGSTTNLSGGLFTAIQELQREEPGLVRNEVQSILLLTDGLANVGVRQTSAIVKIMNSAMKASPNASVFTFGYGSDVSQDMLREISDSQKGMFYHLCNVEDIPTAFADCLGGLLSVVGQGIRLTCEAMDGTHISRVHTKFPIQELEPGRKIEVSIGDMYAEEDRDILVEVTIPAVADIAPTSVSLPTGAGAGVRDNSDARSDISGHHSEWGEEGVGVGGEVDNCDTAARRGSWNIMKNFRRKKSSAAPAASTTGVGDVGSVASVAVAETTTRPTNKDEDEDGFMHVDAPVTTASASSTSGAGGVGVDFNEDIPIAMIVEQNIALEKASVGAAAAAVSPPLPPVKPSALAVFPPLLKFTLQYVDVVAGDLAVAADVLRLERTTGHNWRGSNPAPRPRATVMKHVNRVVVARAMDDGRRAAASSAAADFDRVQRVIASAQEEVRSNLSACGLVEADDRADQDLLGELAETHRLVSSRSTYMNQGQYMMSARAQSHWAQRSNESRAHPAMKGYRKGKKSGMVSKTFTSC